MNKPLLVLSAVRGARRSKLSGGSGKMHFPSRKRQHARLAPKFQRLESAFESHRAFLQQHIMGAMPEEVLVLETVGTVADFYKAVRKIPGMEWLSEWEQTEIAPDEDFNDVNDEEKSLTGRLFLVMSNHQALVELKSLWDQFVRDRPFSRGKTKWRDLFSQLKNVRYWDVSDRVESTGLREYWEEQTALGIERMRFEIELWFRGYSETRRIARDELIQLLRESNAEVMCEAAIPEIEYHSLLVDAPTEIFEDIFTAGQVAFVRCQHVMYCRPSGQAAVRLVHEELADKSVDPMDVGVAGTPRVALFDGLPVENHTLLQDRIVVDDPLGWSATYPTTERVHGTSMASLIIHGDLNDPQTSPLKSPLYVRPIMSPDPSDFRELRSERVPFNVLPIDLVHQAVRRMFEGVNGEPPVAPSVKIINLSIGDESREFSFSISPWARLLDWLSWKYNVLFIVSAGNYRGDIVFDGIAKSEYDKLGEEESRDEYTKYLIYNNSVRRIISPAEAVNVLTIGATHNDHVQSYYAGFRKDLVNSPVLPSPVSRVGLGYRRSIKPDVVMPGGKQLYNERFGCSRNGAGFMLTGSASLGPGQLSATPSLDGDLGKTKYSTGTSNAAALASRLGGQIVENLELLYDDERYRMVLRESNWGVIVKTLIVHGASWGDTYSILDHVLPQQGARHTQKIQNSISSMIGYGHVNADRSLDCTDQRVTLITTEELNAEQAHVYEIPLPPSLSGKREWRRLTVTLGWFTPINPGHQSYRRASLWFDSETEVLNVGRTGAQWQAVRRGSIQHEVFEGEAASAFVDGDSLKIQVNCRPDAGVLDVAVPYSLAVTLEVAEGTDIPVYEEVRSRIQQHVRIDTRTSDQQ